MKKFIERNKHFPQVSKCHFSYSKRSKHSKTNFEKNCFSAWASTLNMGLINKVDMVCLSPVGYGVQLTFRALALRRSRL